jgi:predicted transposase/invertase (TIGR01784 family)
MAIKQDGQSAIKYLESEKSNMKEEVAMKFIDPRIDFAFKKIFGGEDTKDILMNFIESLLDLSGNKKLKDITILDPFAAPRVKGLKLSIIDVKCTDLRGVSYIVEMQVKKTKAFFKRIQYNAAKTYANQIAKGEDYPKLNQVIAVTVTGFTLFEELDAYVTRHATQETETGKEYLSEIIYYVVELSKFEKKIETLDNVLDKWIWFIKYASEIEKIPDNMKEDVFIHAFEKARLANMTPLELEYYDKASMTIADEIGAMELAKEEAEKAGMEKGIKKGMEKGKQEQQKSIAKKMKAKGYSADEIADLTGLSVPEIEKI